VGGQSIEEEQGEEWGVSGLRVLITRDSTVVGHPVVGYYAHIQGFVEANGIVRATYVSVHDPAEAAASCQYQGIIRGITETIPGNWVIGSLVGMVTEATEIVGSPLLGALAEVGGHQTLDGTLLFDTVRIVDQDAYVRLSGTIDKVSLRRGIASLDGYLVVDGQNVLVDSRTLLDESGGRAAVGMHVDVVAQPLGAQNLIALRIRVTQPD